MTTYSPRLVQTLYNINVVRYTNYYWETLVIFEPKLPKPSLVICMQNTFQAGVDIFKIYWKIHERWDDSL